MRVQLPLVGNPVGSLELLQARDPSDRAPWPAPEDGGGHPVVLVPGYLAPRRVMRPMARWLADADYRPAVAELRMAMDCAERLAGDLERQTERSAERAGSKVSLVAHSRGGQMARVVAARRPDLVASLTCLGTPFALFALRPAAAVTAGAFAVLGTCGVPRLGRVQCLWSKCCERFRQDLQAPVPTSVRFTSVWSPYGDRTVSPGRCFDPGAQMVAVSCGHSRMIVDRDVMAAVAVAVAAGREAA